jgi:hypothetical protein
VKLDLDTLPTVPIDPLQPVPSGVAFDPPSPGTACVRSLRRREAAVALPDPLPALALTMP